MITHLKIVPIRDAVWAKILRSRAHQRARPSAESRPDGLRMVADAIRVARGVEHLIPAAVCAVTVAAIAAAEEWLAAPDAARAASTLAAYVAAIAAIEGLAASNAERQNDNTNYVAAHAAAYAALAVADCAADHGITYKLRTVARTLSYARAYAAQALAHAE